MTIQQFQELYYIAQSTDFDLDKSIKMVGAVTGKTPEQVELMPIDKFNKLCSKVTKEFEVLDKRLYKTKPKSLVLASGRLYKINYEINKPPINAGKYVEVITFGKRSEEHTSELQSRENLVCRLLLEKKKTTIS